MNLVDVGSPICYTITVEQRGVDVEGGRRFRCRNRESGHHVGGALAAQLREERSYIDQYASELGSQHLGVSVSIWISFPDIKFVTVL